MGGKGSAWPQSSLVLYVSPGARQLCCAFPTSLTSW